MPKLMVKTAAAVLVFAPVLVMAEDRPLALVEHVEAAPDASVQAFDYLYKDDKIDLRPNGVLRIAYFDRCQVETFTGGQIKLKDDGAKVSKGGASTKTVRPCPTAALLVDTRAREAGVAVKRQTPFPEGEWSEISVSIATPHFVWPAYKKGGEATVTIVYLEADPAEGVWQGSTVDRHLSYPEDAPMLQPGMPYEVIVSYNGKRHGSAVFSIDPGLELPDGLLNATIPIGL